jgi:Ca2+/H+ antiporter, TMEM165/GDT1 family
LHDEERIYLKEIEELKARGEKRTGFDRIGAIVAYKAVLLEGTEVAFIVIAFGAGGPAALNAAIVGAIVAGVLVIALGAALREPLTMVPENWMKFGVGALLSAFGVFWFAEGQGAAWPGDALSILAILAVFLVASWLSVRMLRAIVPGGAQVAGTHV